ncbi:MULTISPECIES: hypothetical protein [Helicobacter]|uniref:hypothetical protein n=1 Tax=Helicobacter TaxID=209 RepID=UPI0026237EB3|nr:hypothetical protein [Helicobacter sp. UBA3407]
MNARSYKAMYSQDYVQKILKMPTQKQKERLENAKRNVDYLKNGIRKGYFGKEMEVLALARMLRENNLLRTINKNLKGVFK